MRDIEREMFDLYYKYSNDIRRAKTSQERYFLLHELMFNLNKLENKIIQEVLKNG